MATGRKSEAKREAVALALAGGQTAKAAAAACDVAERTVGNWLAEAEFARRVDELRAAMVERAMGRMTNAMTKAASTLRKLLEHTDGRIRLGAAKAILEGAAKLRETVVLEARLQVLEAAE